MGLTAEQRQARADHARLVKESRKGTFLGEWLRDAQEGKEGFAVWSATLDADEREAVAKAQGYRTWRAYVACLADKHRALEQFVRSDVFAAVWRALKDSDPKSRNVPWGFSPSNAGTPSKILQGIETWHQTPKFTQTESVRHHKRIADTARDLRMLLEQISPGGFTEAFDRFELSDDEADRALKAFRTPADMRNIYGRSDSPLMTQWTARLYLDRAGIVPLWALSKIEAAARDKKPMPVLPRKVRAKTAYRTFMIGEVAQAIAGMGPRHPLPVGDQLIADAVALLIDADCALDDVRKALMPWRAEDLEAGFEGIIHRGN